ncbi:MAG TPA: hydrogenase nickel incorporation protein HypB [Candidatus Hydrogenedens sp.]|nr:hydrogenase nickel incorporation protein HypB [Candidatus Hydrogenedens sp.]HOK09116.1 hydrogenase nickel incorporation protein HypB [Candidatus Hydrogenedens sp.]HOL20532.1 hydrogenase nickel incorporation protein HypB [Candidatus Hydrogenedens sp.]HPP58824.1 hydrogenase nickel incorporation protein HypB [Candidatus Hydrogenedens sp.]
MKVDVVQKVLKANDDIAKLVRSRFDEHHVFCINMISAPGSGKTSLIESALKHGLSGVRLGVIEGDPETTRDAERIAKYEIPVVQINTAGGCHLESQLVLQALDKLPLSEIDLLIIENVGNLVCPVGFDLGERARVAVVSVTEGHDKPFKYPKLFQTANLVILNKVDLLPHVPFDVDEFTQGIQAIQPGVPILHVSCTRGDGVGAWVQWLIERISAGTKNEM